MDTPFFFPEEEDAAVAFHKSQALDGRLTDVHDIAPIIKHLVSDGNWVGRGAPSVLAVGKVLTALACHYIFASSTFIDYWTDHLCKRECHTGIFSLAAPVLRLIRQSLFLLPFLLATCLPPFYGVVSAQGGYATR
jgi:hypothetical protein